MFGQGFIKRETRETLVEIEIYLKPGNIIIDTGIPFFNHLLETLLFYANFSGKVVAKEKIKVDDHHIVEDVAICLGQAISEALGDRKGIARYGWSIIPMDDSLTICAIDLGGRPYLKFKCKFKRFEIGGLAIENVRHFLYTFAINLKATIHIWVPWGLNDHHKTESIFKALGFALKQACSKINQNIYISIKGIL